MARLQQLLPLLARGQHRGFVIAVEHQDGALARRASGIVENGRGDGAFDEKTHIGGIGIVGRDGQIDRLRFGLAVLRRSMRQEAFGRIGP